MDTLVVPISVLAAALTATGLALRPRRPGCLHAASALSLLSALLCSESACLRAFWPDLWAALSLGLCLLGLLASAERLPLRESQKPLQNRKEPPTAP